MTYIPNRIDDLFLIMIGGPTGIGKTVLVEAILQSDSTFLRPQAYTTRPPRPSDKIGEFIYVSVEDFMDMKNSNQFVRIDEIYGQYYGMEINFLKSMHEKSYRFVKELHVEHHGAFKQVFPQAFSVVLLPKTWDLYKKEALVHEPSISRNARLKNEMNIHFNLKTEDFDLILDTRMYTPVEDLVSRISQFINDVDITSS